MPPLGATAEEVVGAPGFEPGNGGTKNRCLTAWRRPTNVPPLARTAPGFNGTPRIWGFTTRYGWDPRTGETFIDGIGQGAPGDGVLLAGLAPGQIGLGNLVLFG